MTLKTMTTPDVGAADVTVIEILVKVGDTITLDMPIVTLESDKATMEVPATFTGKVQEIKVKIGDVVANGSALMTIETAEAENATETEKAPAEKTSAPKETTASKNNEKNTQSAEKSAEKDSQETVTEEKTSKEETVLTGVVETSDADVHAGPGVRRMARELGVNLGFVSASGPKQRIIKEDVQAFVKRQLSQIPAQNSLMPTGFAPMPVIDFAKFGEINVKALSRIKKISGKNLQRNWMTIPHVTQFAEADISSLEDFRVSQKAEMDKQKIKLTPLVFIMKAVVASLKAFPQMNASLDAAGENLIMKNYFHIGVAVDTPEGLVVPVIRDVDKKGLTTLAKELAQISEKARNKQLMPSDMQGGCFSISSLGGIGGTAFTPIINAPEVGILGVSKSSYKPVYQDGEFIAKLMLPLSLSYDHRVIDGAEGARFIMHLSNMLSDIRNLLL